MSSGQNWDKNEVFSTQYSVSGTKNKRYDETDNGYGFRDIELGYIHCHWVSPGCLVGHDILGA